MLKRTKVGFLIAGGILLLFSIYPSYYFFVVGDNLFWTCFIYPIPGLILLTIGIINASIVSNYNKRLFWENMGHSYTTNCTSCSNPVRVKVQDFKQNRNYPEGFVYCPICKKAISKSAFEKVLD